MACCCMTLMIGPGWWYQYPLLLVLLLLVVVVAMSSLPLVRHRFSRSSSPHEGAGTEALDGADGARDSPISHGKPRRLSGAVVRHAVPHGALQNPSSPGLSTFISVAGTAKP